ncbi:MAG: 50S ribosomal protein L28 [Thermincola sp.]|nr:50S ribosomal protein L28 [Thermincola sp.]
MNSQRGCNSVAKCEICGKGVQTGIQLSHSHIRTKRTWKPNIQKVRALVNGTPTRINVCTRCLRSGKVVRAV